MATAAVPDKQTRGVGLQLFSVRVVLFLALRFYFCLCIFVAFTLNCGFLSLVSFFAILPIDTRPFSVNSLTIS